MRKIVSQVIASTLGFWIAMMFVPGVSIKIYPDSNFFGISLTAQWQIFLFLGIILGLLNYFVKPILDVITLPLRILTLGLFSFVINVILIWMVDVMFKEFNAPWFYPLLYTTLIIFAFNMLISIIFKK